MGCHFLLQGIFLTQGSKLGALHCGQVLYHLSYQGSLALLGLVIHFLNLLHCFPEILDHLHYHYSEFSFWKVHYLHFIFSPSGAFILSFHLRHNFLLFHCGVCDFCSSHCETMLLLAASVCSLMEETEKLVHPFQWEGLWWDKLGLALEGRAVLSKALIQLSPYDWGCAPPC